MIAPGTPNIDEIASAQCLPTITPRRAELRVGSDHQPFTTLDLSATGVSSYYPDPIATLKHHCCCCIVRSWEPSGRG